MCEQFAMLSSGKNWKTKKLKNCVHKQNKSRTVDSGGRLGPEPCAPARGSSSTPPSGAMDSPGCRTFLTEPPPLPSRGGRGRASSDENGQTNPTGLTYPSPGAYGNPGRRESRLFPPFSEPFLGHKKPCLPPPPGHRPSRTRGERWGSDACGEGCEPAPCELGIPNPGNEVPPALRKAWPGQVARHRPRWVKTPRQHS